MAVTRRPYVDFQEVKRAVSMPDVLQAFGLVERFQKRGESLIGVCPLPTHQHGPQPNPDQFRIDLKDGVWLWHCFGDCQRGGDVVEFVKGMTGYGDAHVRLWIAEHFGDRLTAGRPKAYEKRTPAKDSSRETADEVPQTPPPASDENLSEHIVGNGRQPLKPLRFRLQLDPSVPYLQMRGVKPETIARFGIGLCQRGMLKGYVAIPVHDFPAADTPVAYLGRWPGEEYDENAGRPRYKWPKDFEKSRVVYGLQEALDGTEGKPLIVVEGPFSVYHLVQCGFPNSVAIFGSSLSDDQATILASTGRPIILMFDGEEGAERGMAQAAAKLIRRAFVTVVSLRTDCEPDDLSASELQRVLS